MAVSEPITGPFKKVVYIFDRVGERDGRYWYLVLECGHTATRNQPPVHPSTIFNTIESKLAPKKVRCLFCGTGARSRDPWLLIKALGGGQET